MLRLYKFEIDFIATYKIRFIHICRSCCIYCAFLETAPKIMPHLVPIFLEKGPLYKFELDFKTAHKKLCSFIFLEVAPKTILHLVHPFNIRLN